MVNLNQPYFEYYATEFYFYFLPPHQRPKKLHCLIELTLVCILTHFLVCIIYFPKNGVRIKAFDLAKQKLSVSKE